MALDPKESISSMKKFVISVAIFLFVVVLLITHAKTGLTVATVGVIAAILTLAVNRRPSTCCCGWTGRRSFSSLACLSPSAAWSRQACWRPWPTALPTSPGGNLTMRLLSSSGSRHCLGLVEYIPFAATMVPVITSLSATMGVDLNTLAWTLSMGTDIGGSATPIGASANVAGTAIAAREGHPISWGRYCKYSAPAAVIVVAISMGMILLRY